MTAGKPVGQRVDPYDPIADFIGIHVAVQLIVGRGYLPMVQQRCERIPGFESNPILATSSSFNARSFALVLVVLPYFASLESSLTRRRADQFSLARF